MWDGIEAVESLCVPGFLLNGTRDSFTGKGVKKRKIHGHDNTQAFSKTM
jgi:hypothetical protein